MVYSLIVSPYIYRSEAKKLQQQLDHFNSVKGQHEHIHQLLSSLSSSSCCIVNKSDVHMKLNGQYMESCNDVFKGETFFISGFEPQVRFIVYMYMLRNGIYIICIIRICECSICICTTT